MSRQKRDRSSTGVYHIMLRGINRGDIFLEDDDKAVFLNILLQKKSKGEYALHAYCLMDNHLHLLIEEKEDDIARIMKRIGITYVSYFNKKYQRIGPLFQDRYKSEKVENDGYLLTAMRYIHNNPVAAGLVKNQGAYKWSSYNEYLKQRKSLMVADTALILGIFGSDVKYAQEGFLEFMKQKDDVRYLDDYNETDELEQGKRIWQKLSLEKIEGEIRLRELRERTGLSIRKLSIITGINKDKISRILK
ncbi:hypothetical protein SDC9_32543 [bioreactor metagenome]|uniref:Transposase IS200-like domain-containing protein n=2 Tax=bioreactor metagenome TaxID=1076179 RepID=A0A644V5U7_9ZZZZ|nr:transposase [Acidaminococcaceae bacterium]